MAIWIIRKGVQDPIKKQITNEYVLIQVRKYRNKINIKSIIQQWITNLMYCPIKTS